MIPLSMIPWKLVGIGAAVLAIGLLFWHDRHLAGELKKAKVQIEIGNAVNGENLKTIGMQSDALAQWKKLAEDALETAKQAQEHAKAYRDKAASLAADLSKIKEIDRAIPECAALLSTNLRLACPGIEYGLRQLEGDYEADRNSSTGAGNSPTKPRRRLRASVPIQR